ncbi:MAG: rod shape-determining protein MreC [Thermoleophilia bacterium]|nr:rod shape-determining protein MreC [Thermoleophilia bacterium]
MRFTIPTTPKRRPRRSVTPTGGTAAPSGNYMSRSSSTSRRAGSNRSSGSIFPRRRRPAPLVRRMVLAALLAASLGLITATYRGGVVISGAQMVVLDIVAPIERGLTRAWDPIAGAASWTGRLFTATNENPTLKQQNSQLRTRLVVAEHQINSLEQTQQDFAFQERGSYPSSYELVYGRVISRAAGTVDRNITIGLGRDDGIAENDPVMTRDGLIGRVLKVSSNAATVALIINENSSVTSLVSGTTAEGTLKTASIEGTPVMRLDYVRPKALVQRGDVVVTSGFVLDDLRSLYPAGLPIGHVSSVGNSPGDVYKTVQVTPFADFESIRNVFVLVPKGGDRVHYEAPGAVTPATSLPTADRRADKAVTDPAPATKRAKNAASSTKGDAAE